MSVSAWIWESLSFVFFCPNFISIHFNTFVDLCSTPPSPVRKNVLTKSCTLFCPSIFPVNKKKKHCRKQFLVGKKCSKYWSKTVWPLDINYSRLWGVIWVGMEFTLEVSLSLSGPFCFKCVIWDLQYNMRMYYALWRYTNWQRWLNAVYMIHSFKQICAFACPPQWLLQLPGLLLSLLTLSPSEISME